MLARLMGLPTIDPATLHSRLAAGEVAVFDVNSPASWRQARVPGARPLDPDAFTASDLPASRERTLVFYCSNPLCRKAPRAAQRARKLGFADVAVLAAGISGWVAGGYPTESGGDA